jgi:hypothetical protein
MVSPKIVLSPAYAAEVLIGGPNTGWLAIIRTFFGRFVGICSCHAVDWKHGRDGHRSAGKSSFFCDLSVIKSQETTGRNADMAEGG